MVYDQSQQADVFWTHTSRRGTGLTSSHKSWVTARKVAGVDANSLPKRRVSESISSSNQSSLGDTAVAAKAAQQVKSRQAT